MRRITIANVLVLAMVLTAQQASGGILSQNLTFDGIEDTLIDESRAQIIELGGSGFIDDVIFGYVSVSDQQPDFGSLTDEIAILFSAQVVSQNTNGSFNLGKTTVTGLKLADLVNSGLGPVENGLGDAIAVVVTNDGSRDPLSPAIGPGGAGTPTDPGDLKGFLATEWTYEMTVGIGTANASDFFQFSPITGTGTLLGEESAGLSVLDHPFGPTPPIEFLPVAVTRQDGTGTSTHEIKLFDGTIFKTGQDGWEVKDKATMGINVTPEPGSLIIWGLLLFGGAGLARRQSRKKKRKLVA